MNNQPTIQKNHMDILWHEFADKSDTTPITGTSLPAKASVIGRVGFMMLACGTGAWRVRSSMNTLSELMGITCTVDIGLMSINYTCFDGTDSFSRSLCLTNTGVNTSQLTRLEKFVSAFSKNELTKNCEQIHSDLDEIEKIRGLYSPVILGLASALACCGFTARRRSHRNAVCLCWCRNRKLHKMQTWQKTFYFVFMYHFRCICSVPELHSIIKNIRPGIFNKFRT